jgi:hypothetical protein
MTLIRNSHWPTFSGALLFDAKNQPESDFRKAIEIR